MKDLDQSMNEAKVAQEQRKNYQTPVLIHIATQSVHDCSSYRHVILKDMDWRLSVRT